MTEVRTFADAIRHNLKTFRDAQEIRVAPVIKSNAYGHGIVEVGKIVAMEDVPFVCVNSLDEAAALRAAAVQAPILILGYTPLDAVRASVLPNVSFGVISIEGLRGLASAGVSTTIHLEIDTGMHRHGIMPEEVSEALELIAASPLTLEGVYSHLADGDTKGSELTATQIARWNDTVHAVKEKCPEIQYWHLSATTGVAYVQEIDANVARLGIGLYGFNESLIPLDLKPALEMRTRITSIRTVPKGERVGYGGTYVAPSDRRIATVPVGYNEGVDRRLSNKGAMLVREKHCPIVGRVSMNITSLDVTDVTDIALDDEVVVISANPSDPNSVANIAQLCDTISYEVVTGIPSTLLRTVV